MDENSPSEENLADEFRTLGQNLVKSLNALWQSPQRKRLQDEIEDGLHTLMTTVKAEAAEFSQSPTGQRLKSDLEDLQHSLQNSQVEAKVRQELLKALRMVNAELEKMSAAWSREDQPADAGETRET